ncbi:DUF262 domain-containing protein [Elizabethkingia anophelis]|nr:DUF262 domain-containing protein [Elizabethkingia anophelis]MCT3694726.1 DUF262 domain-containing protein [Elizabethkingia anophelis]MCT3858046.1 DUF262 domain-containing protein [Elizabethkingia anophelis]MCT3911536.1 DUF262 domain-containing protein [Elizabethkingia anophelis]MCT4311115.1 DUF262 domain-containing protein [Elizabethkingia anophelis]
MNKNALKEVSIEEILHHYNLIVPEIQREYVWGYNAHNIVDIFISDIVEGISTKDLKIQSDKENLQNMIDSPDLSIEAKEALKIAIQQIPDSSLEMNIGFLYSYRPGYSTASKDRDLYLIDGQQRFTTLFLLLFYFAIKEKRENDFTRLFKINISNGSLGFDYRVRNLTHHFFVELFTHTRTIEDLLNVRNKIWFLNNFSLDVTIRSIVGDKERKSLFHIFEEKFNDSTEKYFDYIRTKIKFWHFKTEETSQGEELYITMNSRGQQLADNESIRAKLFDSDIVRNNPLEWSEQWENWQNFFWKNRSKIRGFSADEGFNEFLRWVQLLKMIEKQTLVADSNLENKIHYLQSNKKDLDIIYLDLEEIEVYYKSLVYIKNFFSDHNLRMTLKAFGKYRNVFKYSILNFINGNSLSQNQLFILLPLLAYCKKNIESNNQIDDLAFFRVFKFVTNLSLDSNIGKSIRDQILNIVQHISLLGINEDITELLSKDNLSKSIINEEQKEKLSIYKHATTAEERLKIEDSFWYCETLKYINGEILYLIKLALEIKSSFNIEVFNHILKSYILFLNNENISWGNLLATDVYYEDGYRILRSQDIKTKKGLLKLIKNIYLWPNENFDLFIESIQKDWIQTNYPTYDNLKTEKNRKKQLYILYIISTNDFNKNFKWDWNEEYNIGVFEENYNGLKSIFEKPYIYQIFKNSFRTNHNKILKIHSAKFKQNMLIEKLIEWSKK